MISFMCTEAAQKIPADQATPNARADSELLEALLRGKLTEDAAARFAQQAPEVIVFTLLTLQKRLAETAMFQPAAGPHTPSSAVPPYAKPNTAADEGQSRRRRKRGGQPGHAGSRRTPSPQPDRQRIQQHPACPDCGGQLKRTGRTRSRITEDIGEDLQPVVTEDIIHRDWCPSCKKQVEPSIPDVLPRSTIGNRTLVLSALLHFLQGLTISQVIDTFNFHLRMPLTSSGLVQMWHRLADILYQWYEQIHSECLQSASLNADETGWRVNGETHWLWCFANDTNVFYMIDRSRGSPALSKFFTEAFDGVLISDFWSPYDALCCAEKQKCWPHLLRDAAAVDEKASDDPEWRSFSRRLIGVYRAAKKRHSQRGEMAENDYDISVVKLENRLARLGAADWHHPDARRLAKRLAKYGHQLLTFLWHESVPSDNNHAERMIRPAVMIRKNSYANGSERGAATQSVLMTVFKTLQKRGLQPIDTLLAALTTYAATGQLPPLPAEPTESRSNG